MTNGPIDIDETQGDVAGVMKDSIGSIAARIVKTGRDLVINNYTLGDRETLKKIQDLSLEINTVEKDKVSREEFNALQQQLKNQLEIINDLKNLLERNQASSIKAGDVQVSHIELSVKEIILKGNEHFGRGQFSIALDYYDQAIKIDPNYTDAWNNKGNALGDLGKYNEAIECYDRAIEIDPNFARPWNNKGNVLHNLGKDDEAIECYDKGYKDRSKLC